MQVGSNRPIDKVLYSVMAGAFVAILAWGLKEFAGIELPPEIQNAAIVLISGIVAYMTPIAPGEIVATDGTPIEENT